jgi:hypothetical protein
MRPRPFDFGPVGKAILDMFRYTSPSLTVGAHGFEVVTVNALDVIIPVFKLNPGEAQRSFQEYLIKKCRGDLRVAQSKPQWTGHTIMACLPAADILLKGLHEGGYFKNYTESMIYYNIYQAILKVNPTMEYEQLPWPEPEEEKWLKPFQKDIAVKTKASLSLLRMRWGDDVNTADDVHLYLTKAMEAIDKYVA